MTSECSGELSLDLSDTCSDDPWNQTPADNPQWLRDFKRLVGLDVNVEVPEQPSQIIGEAIQTACGG